MTVALIGSPVIFYWQDGQTIAGIVASHRVESGVDYYYVALFDPTNTFSGSYYPSAIQATSKDPGSFQVVSTPATIS